MKIVVAMSGGVDSSVVAHMLVEQGHEVIGIMMKLWSDPLAPVTRDFLPKKCCSIEHIERARSVCRSLAIPFYVTNLEDEFKTQVVDYYLEGHLNALTPNPCIECNRLIKFGALFKKMQDLGFDALATGHYALIEPHANTHVIKRAKDTTRDQSYYLYTLNEEVRQHILFPLGNLQKSDVFALAKKYGISIPETYAESEDLCFYPENNPEPFLKRYLPTITPGPIKNIHNEVIGTHKGLPFYTKGQRKGLGIGGLRIPLHVIKKEASTNTIYVAEAGSDLSTHFTIHSVYWHYEQPSNELLVRVSSLGTFFACTIETIDSVLHCTLKTKVRGVASGQSAVFYDGDLVIGGGIIQEDSFLS